MEENLEVQISKANVQFGDPNDYKLIFGRMWPEGCVYNNELIIFGGQKRGSQEFTNTIAKINLKTFKSEYYGAPKGIDVPIVAGHRICRIEDRMYVFGGVQSHYLNQMNSMHEVNLNLMEWKLLTIKGKIPTPREGMSLTPVKNRFIYICGGGTKIDRFEIFEFDTKSLTCRRFPLDDDILTPSNRFYHTIEYIPSVHQLFLFGGYDFGRHGRDVMEKFHIFDLETKKFKKPVKIPIQIWTKGLSEFTTHRIGNYIVFVFGRQEGLDKNYVQCACYEYKRNLWFVERKEMNDVSEYEFSKELKIRRISKKETTDSHKQTQRYFHLGEYEDDNVMGVSKNTRRAGHCSGVFEKNKIIVFGGSGRRSSHGEKSDLLIISTNILNVKDDHTMAEEDELERVKFLGQEECCQKIHVCTIQLQNLKMKIQSFLLL